MATRRGHISMSWHAICTYQVLPSLGKRVIGQFKVTASCYVIRSESVLDYDG